MRQPVNLLRQAFVSLLNWLGLGDASDDHLTPSHGWLLPTPEPAMALRKDGVARSTAAPLK
jgi:hypothetical protein